VNGGLAQDVAGLGAYTMIANHLYIAATIYRSEHLGTPLPYTSGGGLFNIRGVAPYWRAAWQQTSKNNYLEVGTYGMYVRVTPGDITGLKDDYTDWAIDFQDDVTIPKLKGDVLSLRGSYTRENSTLNASYNGGEGSSTLLGHHLNSVQANAEYHFGDRVAGTMGWFNTDGTPDPLFYNGGTTPPAPVTGSANGDPRSAGYIANVSWWPVQNIGLTLQYTGYTRFNGGSANYDANGRTASANNTIYLLARFVF
jgi:hypothetical protein